MPSCWVDVFVLPYIMFYFSVVASSPENLRVSQISVTGILVEWDQPTDNTTAYQIVYSKEQGSKPSQQNFVSYDIHSSTGEVNWFLLNYLRPGCTYSVSMRGLSQNLPSDYTPLSIITLSSNMSSSTMCNNSFERHYKPSQNKTSDVPHGQRNETKDEVDECSSGFTTMESSTSHGLIAGLFFLGVVLGTGVCAVVAVALLRYFRKKESSKAKKLR